MRVVYTRDGNECVCVFVGEKGKERGRKERDQTQTQ